jgi:lipopolysaccharide/colanic/teichoic acid biosynthesis glycosyltransferase
MSSIVDERLFQRLLWLERLRCERTEGYFALLLIDMEELSSRLNISTSEEIGRAIAAAMRETDITGWYQYASTIGIVLTTLNGNGRESFEPVMLERINAILSLHLDDAQIKKVQISCHVFPDERSNRIFYSDKQSKDVEKKSSRFIKRAIDVTGSLIALLVLSPLFVVIAILIKLTSRGSVFFKQRRVGQFGEEFTFLKFRSMHVNADPTIHREYVQKLIQNKVNESGGTYKIKNDPRITSVGNFLRKSSLDELPQFINVFKGEMSLVGPRPPIPYEFETYSLWHRRRILEVKPGITGEWQVHGRSRTSFDDMVRMDLHYIRNQSTWLDLKILAKTPFAVISGNGAY